MDRRLAEVLSVFAIFLSFACGAAGEGHGARFLGSSGGSYDGTELPAPLASAEWESKGFRELPPAIITDPGGMAVIEARQRGRS